jgi:pyruvate-formate lyase
VDFATLLDAIEGDFADHAPLLARIRNRVPRFGQDADLPRDIANQVLAFAYDRWQAQPHYRGGHYVPGYWSMSNHVAFGMLSGALPSGRRKGEPFTPGLTPAPYCAAPLTEQLRTVAGLDPIHIPNNIAFNVKVAPGTTETHTELLDRMTALAGAYFDQGGMQIQFNVMTSDDLRRAMDDPCGHRDLLVRISGYNAYFVELNRNMQLELIDRAEHGCGVE